MVGKEGWLDRERDIYISGRRMMGSEKREEIKIWMVDIDGRSMVRNWNLA